jgi:hypothetical protein
MKKHKLDINRAFNNIISTGVGESGGEDEGETKASVPALSESQPQKTADSSEKRIKKGREKRAQELTPVTFYITKRLYKALKLKAALSDEPTDKDQSAIVRAALDIYLSDTLKKFEV